MADEDDDDVAAPEEIDSSTAEPAAASVNPFAQYAAAPAQDANPFAKYAAPQQAAASQDANPFAKYAAKPADQPDDSNAPGPIGTFLRHAAHAVLPSASAVAGAETGAGIGAAIGAPFGGVGAGPGGLIGGVIGGIGGYMLGSAVQEAGLKAVGADDSVALAVGEKLNPKSALVGDIGGSLPFFGVGTASRLVRGAGAAFGTGMEAIKQYQGDEGFDPIRLGMAGAAGATLVKPTAAAEAVSGAAARLVGRTTPMIHGTPGAKAAAGTAEEQVATAGVGDQPGANRQYAKGEPPPAVEPTVPAAEQTRTGDTTLDAGLQASLQPEPPAEPAAPPPAAEAARPATPVEPTAPAPEAPAPAPEPIAVEPGNPRVQGDLHVEPNPDGPGHVLMRGDETVSQHPNLGQAFMAMNREAKAGARAAPEPAAAEAAPPVDLRQRISDAETAPDPAAHLRETAAMYREQGQEGRARQIERGADAVERSQQRQQQQRQPQQQQQQPQQPQQPPAGGGAGTPPRGPPPGGPAGAPPTGGGAPGGPAQPTAVPIAPRSNFANLARAVKGLVAPQTLGPLGRQASNLIRGAYGEAGRLADQTISMLMSHRDTVRPMDEMARRALNNRIEGGNAFPGYQPTPEQQRLIDGYKPVMDAWKNRLQQLGRTATMNFHDNYLAHNMYENPAQAQAFFRDFAAKRGGSGSTKARTFPTLEDAYAAGIKPISNDPLEMGVRYINSMKNFVAANDVLERGIANGTIMYHEPTERVGASGAVQPLERGGPPPGWVRLEGAPPQPGKTAYAPEDFARVYNNYYDQGMLKNNRALVDGLRKASNSWTALELGLNTYHLFTMANEALIVDVKRGLNQIFSGQGIKGLKTITQAPAAPYMRAIEGRKFQQDWLDPNSTDPMVQAISRANARPIGRGHAADYTYSDRGSFIQNFSPQKIGSELQNALSEIKADWKGADTLSKQAMFPLKQSARVLQTIAAPLFDKYIPMVKAGAIHAQMRDWVEAQPNFDIKNMTAAQRQALDNAAVRITDSVDNSFGEMVHDNLFMNAALKQSAQVAMRSFSWNIGTMKEIGGGLYAGGKALGALAKGENRFSMAHPEFDPRIAYSIAMPFAVATTSAIYQYLRAGEAPHDWRDLYAPRTGGLVPGGHEHVLMPGYQKDVLGWIMHPVKEAYNKLGGLPTTAIEQLTNQDWRGAPIAKPGTSLLDQLQQRAEHLYSKLGPISVKNMIKGQKAGSHITPVETALGFHTPSVEIQAPERYANAMRQKAKKEWQAKQKFERRQQNMYQPRAQ